MANLNNMATSVVQSNEVVKAEDFNFGFDNIVNNITVAAQLMFDPDNDFVIGGKVSAYTGSDMNIVIAPVFGVCKSTLQSFGDSNTSDPVAIETSTVQRTAIVEVKGEFKTYDSQQRAFLDYDTQVKTYQETATKKKLVVSISIKYASGDAAPEVDSGYVKLAEILIPANASTISECTIRNITADIADMENDEWTTEKTATYNIGYISDVNTKFRQAHNNDGSHKAGVISASHLNTGTGSSQVNADILPIAAQVTVGDETISSSTSIKSTVQTIAALVTSLYSSYIKDGAYNFSGTLAIGKDSDYTSALKLESDGSGNANIYIGSTKILTITLNSSGTYTINVADSSKYSITTSGKDSSTTKIVTTVLTNAIWDKVSSLSTEIETVASKVTGGSEYSNAVFGRYSVYSSAIKVATSAEITLSGEQTVSGVAVSAGETVLVKNQSDATQNGVYEVQTGTWNRVSGLDADDSLCNLMFAISNGGKVYYTPLTAITIGTTEITFYESIFKIGSDAFTVAMRDSGGRISMAAPTSNCHGVNKGYADACYSPLSHASSATTYGIGNATNYGHVKISDSYSRSSGAACDGVAASSLALYCVYSESADHIDTAMTCAEEAYTCATRMATSQETGMVDMISDAFSTKTYSADDSVAASPLAVYCAYTCAYARGTLACNCAMVSHSTSLSGSQCVISCQGTTNIKAPYTGMYYNSVCGCARFIIAGCTSSMELAYSTCTCCWRYVKVV